MRQYLIVALICFSWVISGVEHLFMCLLHICISSLDKCLFKSSVHLWIGLLEFCCWVFHISRILIPYQMWSKHFLPSVGCLSTLSIVSFNTQFLNFYPNYFFPLLSLVPSPRNDFQIHCCENFVVSFLLGILYSYLLCLDLWSTVS